MDDLKSQQVSFGWKITSSSRGARQLVSRSTTHRSVRLQCSIPKYRNGLHRAHF